MIVYNEDGTENKSPDLEKGYITEQGKRVYHYPSGNGWNTRDESGKDVPYGDIDPSMFQENEDGSLVFANEEGIIPDWWQFGIYTPYTPEELTARKDAQERIEAEQRAMEWLPGAPDVVEDHDEAIVALYEGMTLMQLETDEMLTTLYEQSL